MKRAPLLIAAIAVIAHLLCINEYGIFRDELYYLACAEHLDWGYVDQPPLSIAILWLVRNVFGESLFAIRILVVLAHASLILLTAALAWRLGGGTFAQSLAALCTAIAPVYISVTHFFSMNAFEALLWMGCVYVAVTIFEGASEKRWLWFGALAGLSLQNKQTTLFFGAAFVIGMLLSPQRKHLVRPWIWLGGLVALLIYAPNLLWQVQHDFATYELLSNIAKSTKNAPVNAWTFLTAQLTLMNPITTPVWIAGLVWLIRSRAWRALGWTFVALYVLFVIMKGKVYYISPAFPMLLAAGAVWLERFGRPVRAAAFALVAIAGIAVAPLALPILPVKTYLAYADRLGLSTPRMETQPLGSLPQHYADMFGWPDMVATIARVYHSLPPGDRAKCAIYGENYGQAGAIDFYGPRHGLPKAISGHQNYFFWGHHGHTGEVMIVLDSDREDLEEIFTSVEEVAFVRHPYAMPYENWPVYLCRGPKITLPQLWPRLKYWL